jgi:hypothetical protein
MFSNLISAVLETAVPVFRKRLEYFKQAITGVFREPSLLETWSICREAINLLNVMSSQPTIAVRPCCPDIALTKRPSARWERAPIRPKPGTASASFPWFGHRDLLSNLSGYIMRWCSRDASSLMSTIYLAKMNISRVEWLGCVNDPTVLCGTTETVLHLASSRSLGALIGDYFA